MAWTIGDNGFDMVLSTYVPDILEANLSELLAGIGVAHPAGGGDQQAGRGSDRREGQDVDIWAVHPGGRAILDKVARGLGFDDAAGSETGAADPLAASRRVLRGHGNMSSPTILFVLEDLLTGPGSSYGPSDASICALAFGPGLTVETAMLRRIGGRTAVGGGA